MSDAWHEERAFIPVADHRLRCVVTRPRAEGAHPAVLLLPALGARPRTGPLDEAPPNDGVAFLVRSLAAAGLVTLRVDASGIGESGGPAYGEASLAADLEGHRVSLAALAALPFVDPTRVFVIGHSLGGVLAPLVADEVVLAGVVVYGATSRRWSECLADTARRQLELAGVPGHVREREAMHAARLYDLVLRQGASPARVAREHPELSRCRAAADLSDAHLHGRALHYFRALDRGDVEAAWRHVRAPALALHGEHDWIVAADDAARIAAWVEAAGQRATALTLDGLDHDLLRQPSLGESFARRGRGILDPGMAEVTLAWMRAEIDRASAFTRGDTEIDTAGALEVSR